VFKSKTLIQLVWVGLISLGLGFITIKSSEAAESSCSTSLAKSYRVEVCIRTPTSSTGVSGIVPVTASVSPSSEADAPGIQSVEFLLDGVHLLTDYSAPFVFQLPSERFVDGTRLLSAQALMRDGFVTDQATLQTIFSNGVLVPPVNHNTFRPTTGTLPDAGQPLVLAATGDGASGETPEVPQLIASWSPNLFLYLGDVYEVGTYTEMYNWYGIQPQYFGQFRAITDPVIGNHEYQGGDANGFLDYWDIGQNAPTYYSFNAGGWHFIALNANDPVSQDPGSPQYQWLAQDLADNTATCTLAYWHQPLFNIGSEGVTTRMSAIWTLLAQHQVDIVLNGHDHNYQRWQALDAEGNVDIQNGITEFVVGTGGHGIQSFVTTDDRLTVGYDTSPTAFGALRMLLFPEGTTFQYMNIAGTILDSGTIGCHRAGDDTTPPNPPTDLKAIVDDNRQVVLNWSPALDNLGIAGYTIYRDGEKLTWVNGNVLTYTDSNVALGTTYTYQIDAFDPSNRHSQPSRASSVTLPSESSLTFTPDADSFIDSSDPHSSFGDSVALRMDVSPDTRSFVRFNVQSLPSGRVVRATLRLYSNSTSDLGYEVSAVQDTDWNEADMTFTNAPTFGQAIGFNKTVSENTWSSVDVTSVVSGSGVYSFGLSTQSPTALAFSSREGEHAPELILVLAPTN
jgi:hypothetical protein